MDAEPRNVDLASRKAAYLNYAGQFKRRLDLFRRAGIHATLTIDATPQETEELLSEARRVWSEPVEAFGPAEELVRKLGPVSVVESIDRLSTELTDYRTVVHEAIVADKESRDARIRAARSAYEPTYRAYLEFLYAATDVIGDDDVLRLRILVDQHLLVTLDLVRYRPGHTSGACNPLSFSDRSPARSTTALGENPSSMA